VVVVWQINVACLWTRELVVVVFVNLERVLLVIVTTTYELEKSLYTSTGYSQNDKSSNFVRMYA